MDVLTMTATPIPRTLHMSMLGIRDIKARIERLRQAAAKKGRVVRVVDQKTAVVPLHADTLADPHKLLASIRSLVELAPER
jgi:transcription-repair coupling factor (superfamily II helicase)